MISRVNFWAVPRFSGFKKKSYQKGITKKFYQNCRVKISYQKGRVKISYQKDMVNLFLGNKFFKIDPIKYFRPSFCR